MSWRAVWCATVAFAGAASIAAAQEVDSAAAAVGVYRPVLPTDTMRPPGVPADSLIIIDTLTGDTLRSDTLSPDTLAARLGADSVVDTARRNTGGGLVPADSNTAAARKNALQPADEREADDTSLTARMDASRGGGLRRQDFPDLLNTAKLTGNYRTFIELMDRSSLRRLLTGSTAVTIFAPTDSAFAKLPQADLERLRNNSAARDGWLGTLIFNGDLRSADLVKAAGARSRGGNLVHFVYSSSDKQVRAGQARVVQADLIARNGILHGVDRVTLTAPTSASP
jgi:uncharacterized surface protein with fasciclin (FAS1) repeats